MAAGAAGTAVGIMATGTGMAKLPTRLMAAGATVFQDMPVLADMAGAAAMVVGAIDDDQRSDGKRAFSRP